MEKNKAKKTVVGVIIVAFVVFCLWLIVIYPLIRFNSNESLVSDAAKRYFQINSSKLPTEGEMATIDVTTLLDKKYITDLRTAYNKNTCDTKNSWVKVKKQNGEYKYYVYLKCGVFSSNIDHKGPEIVLNGDSTINLEKGSKFSDPGVKSVTDNTDGKIDIKEVYTTGEVSTDEVGTYEIKYSAVDSFLNKTVVTRKVVVSQSLEKTVKSATDSDNIYKGNVTNNYIKFSGQLFRIVGVDSDGNIKIVSNEEISNVDYNSIDSWLNDYYYKNIAESSKKYLVTNYNWCSDVVSKDEVSSKTKCNSFKNKQNVGLLSINEYNSSQKEGESYLYTNMIDWTSSKMSDKKTWTTRSSFIGFDSKYLDFSTSYNFNVRPSVVIKSGVKVTAGDGSINNPFEINDFKTGKAGSKVSKRYSGEYISYGSILYRIVETTDDGYTKVITTTRIENDRFKYGTGSQYDPTKKGNIGYLIENTAGNYVKVGAFVKKEISVPIYSNKASYTAKKTLKKYKVKFSAPSMYEMYSSSIIPSWYIESSKKAGEKYLLSDNGTVYFDSRQIESSDGYIRFTGYLKKTATILSGRGTKSDPYKISY